MMPTFPRSSLSFRTAGFPSTAGRLAYQGDLPESVNQLKPAPGMRWSAIGLSSPLRAPRGHYGSPALCQAADSHPLEWQLASLHGHWLPMRAPPVSYQV